jgi:Zn-dependent protease
MTGKIKNKLMNITENIAYPIAWYIVFIISVTIHEAAHALAAKRGGDLTAYSGGQVSLNPFPHMKREPWGMVIFPLISAFIIGWPFGYASTPYDPELAYRNPRKSSLMGLAGPAANLLLILICVLIVKLGIVSGIFWEPYSVGFLHIVDSSGGATGSALTLFISMLFSMNLILLILNLIPFPPLDGTNLITLFLNDNSARKFHAVTGNWLFGLIGLLLAWQAFSPLFRFIFPGVMNIIYPGSGFHY